MIQDLIGKKYLRNGRGPDAYDCYGLVIEIARRMGKTVKDMASCDRTEIERQVSTLGLVRIDAPSEWCVVETVGPDGGLHLGVVLPGLRQMIHSVYGHGVIVSPLCAYRARGFYGFD